MDLPRDLIELFSAFAKGKVRYLLVGGHAVAAHGRPRSTKDVDLWLAPEDANIQRACRALASFGAPAAIIRALSESKPEDIVWMGRAPTRIDFLRTLPGGGVGRAGATPHPAGRRLRRRVDDPHHGLDRRDPGAGSATPSSSGTRPSSAGRKIERARADGGDRAETEKACDP
jgi:hypothetical protein